jgi:paraquat-inducible protein B
MTERTQAPDPTSGLPEARIDMQRRLSTVWLIPIVALLTALWLGYQAYSSQGPLITIRFQTAEGLEAGKTRLRYKDVDVGVVETIDLSPDLSEVLVRARLKASLADYLGGETRFWVVRPRLSGGQISGLDTVLGGVYIGVDLSDDGPSTRVFEGLEAPPVVSANQSGRHFTLVAERLGSVAVGAPVRYRGIEVGRVSAYELAAQDGVHVQVFIDAPHDREVHAQTRFWNDSGFQLVLDAQGVRVDTESLTSLLLGGISFANLAPDGEPVEDGHRFALFADEETALTRDPGDQLVWELEFGGSVRGLLPGAPVEFRGIRVGKVQSVRLDVRPDGGAPRIPVAIAIEPSRLGLNDYASDGPGQQSFWDGLVARGLRAQLKTGNLVSGALFVDLDFYPDAEPAAIAWRHEPPRLPTVPTAFDELRGLISTLARLPLDEMGRDLGDSLTALRDTMGATNTLLRRLDDETASELNQTLAQTRATLAQAEKLLSPNSALQTEAYRALRELGAAARSFRLMADYLERHPEALIRGKGGEGP